MTEIVLRKGNGPNGELKYDLIAKDLPKNFLGMAADLQFEGSMAKADYHELVWGQSVQNLLAEQQPIKLVKALPDQNRIVIGLSFRANNLPDLSDGVMATLWFKGQGVELNSITREVLSIYENGRRDWPMSYWSIENQSVSDEKTQLKSVLYDKTTKASKGLAGDELVSLSGGSDIAESPTVQALEGDFEQVALWEILNKTNTDEKGADFGWLWLILPIFFLLLLAAVVGWFWRKGKETPREPGFRAISKADLLDY